MNIHLRCLMSLGSRQNTVTVELTRVTICTMLLGLGNQTTPKMSHLWSFKVYTHALAFMGNAAHVCWPLDPIIQPNTEKSFTDLADSVDWGSMRSAAHHHCERILPWFSTHALHALRNQPNEWEVTKCLPMCPQVKAYWPAEIIYLKGQRNRQRIEIVHLRAPITTETNVSTISLQPLGR